MVVPAESRIEVRNMAITREIVLAIDGQFYTYLSPETEITVEKSPRKAKFVRFTREVYPKYTLKLKKRF